MKNDIIWAPWRLAYVAEDAETKQLREQEGEEAAKLVGADGEPTCFLCQAVAAERCADPEAFDRRRHVIGRTETTVAVLNRFPYNNGHLLIAPKRHVARLDELTQAEQLTLMSQIDGWVRRLEATMRPDGFNVGLNLGRAAGAGLPGHLHWHIVPRWNGDTNFMASLASTKVIPQSLDALWELMVKR